jgi:hypothetical protein
MRSIFAAIIMLSASTAVVHIAQAQKHAPMQHGYGYMHSSVGHRQPTHDDVTGANQVQFDKKSVEKDKELPHPPPTHDKVTGVGQVEAAENALAKMIGQENARLDRELRGICRGC